MSDGETLQTCPVCKELYLKDGPKSLEQPVGRYRYGCKRCGTYDIEDRRDFRDSRHLVSAWIRRQNNIGVRYPFVGGVTESTDIWLKKLEQMGFPRTPSEKMDALLKAYARIVGNDYSKILKLHLYPELISEVAAGNIDEIKGLNNLLKQLNYVDFAGTSDSDRASMRAEGWFHIEELRKRSDSGSSAFIAMWFDESITGEYRKAVVKAVDACRYQPVIVDQHEFNGFIMEQVITLIRQSRLIIADFTCMHENDDNEKPKTQRGVRGGVYWEAGFAYGLNKPVIHTCKDDIESRRRIHFDVDQYNTIFWKDGDFGTEIRDLKQGIENPSFMEKLANRILVTAGEGSYVPEKK